MSPFFRLLLISATGLSFCSSALAGNPAFTSVAGSAGVAAVHGTAGYNHWDYTGGGAVGDFNNDGRQDFFWISGGNNNQADKLFINNGDGTFTNQASAWGLAVVHRGKGASVGDFNKDGWLDLYVTSAGPVGGVGPGHHKLYRNNGDGTFTNIAASAGVNVTSPAQEDGFGSTWGDYDLDGDLDLFVAGFANSNAGSRLFRNNGNETFTDVTSAVGLFAGAGQMYAFTPRLIDTNKDWWPELLLVADFGTSHYFKNDGDGTFTEWSDESNTGLDENGMGGNVGDFNGDGELDWYVTSIYLPGNGWTGNKLYLNSGNHLFHEAAAIVGVNVGGYGWGNVAVDFNHDGTLDIAETNGDDAAPFNDDPAYLWIQTSPGSFTEMAAASGFVHSQGRGMVNFDYDNDGDQDVIIFANNAALTLFRNDLTGPDANWLRVFLDSSGHPDLAPNGHNSRLQATTGSLVQHRVISSGDNFLSHGELSAHFGMAAATMVDELFVEWPNGATTTLQNVAVNQTLVITPDGVFGDLNGNGDVNAADLALLLGSWGPCVDCAADLNADGTVNAADLALLLGSWGS